MSITVGKLIRELKNYPSDSKVGISHHDNSEDEIAATVMAVRAFDWRNSDEPEANRGVEVVLDC